MYPHCPIDESESQAGGPVVAPVPDLAVILAAGVGVRLGRRTRTRPKGLLDLGGVQPVPRSVACLRRAGVRKILVGTGHCAVAYDAHFEGDRDVRCVPTDRFRDTGSLFTLAHMSAEFDAPILLLESDLLYEPRALQVLLADPRPDVILATPPTGSGDEVFIEREDTGMVVRLSKDASTLTHPDCEFVGITKLSPELVRLLARISRDTIQEEPELSYEEGLSRVAGVRPIPCAVAPDLVWCEIDDERQREQALRYVLPRLERCENGP